MPLQFDHSDYAAKNKCLFFKSPVITKHVGLLVEYVLHSFFDENCSAKVWEEGEWGRVMEREHYVASVEFL